MADVSCSMYKYIKRINDEHIIAENAPHTTVLCVWLYHMPTVCKMPMNINLMLNYCQIFVSIVLVFTRKLWMTIYCTKFFVGAYFFFSPFSIIAFEYQRLANASDLSIANPDFYHHYGSMTIKLNLLCIRSEIYCLLQFNGSKVIWICPYKAQPVAHFSRNQTFRWSYFMLTIHLIQWKITFLAPLKIPLFSFVLPMKCVSLFDAKQFRILQCFVESHFHITIRTSDSRQIMLIKQEFFKILTLKIFRW